ncbi:Ig-like domain-containing protein [Candidatus Entotheonella palauensis]|uniref:Ig-like domain-containing protein n=1 Tax=Candidatus Entotheonella palauensis TaxID=93172 RepID=UPI0015C472D2|nr:Ig-like domain-containing protein [Candidatus Entotheonella palauensis]
MMRLLPYVLLVAFLFPGFNVQARHGELPNRIPEAAPYNVDEAAFYPPPYEDAWSGINNPTLCAGCHTRIFKEWNGSMMANAWRDPGWRGAFLLLSRMTATDGNCDLPDPPDGTPKAKLNPFANSDCSSTFDLGTTTQTTTGSGSLLDDFCSRCHMPANYVDQVPLANVSHDHPSGLEHGLVQPTFDPTSDNGTGTAFATVEAASRNTASGKLGISCAVCHTTAETRHTPYHNYQQSGTEYVPALGTQDRRALVDLAQQDILHVPDETKPNLGWGIGAGAYRLSPHAINAPERFGPLTNRDYTEKIDPYVSDVFNIDLPHQQGNFSIHQGYYHTLFERAEFCGTCHDVTNPLTIKNQHGKWVGGFPIERTYSEWANSRYADRPGNTQFDPNFKRDCQTCHMQQDYGQPGTAQTLYVGPDPVAPIASKVWLGGTVRPAFYTHHFVGGNAYITQLIGANLDAQGQVASYPKLSAYSYSSASKTSPYANAYWETADGGPPTQHARFAWDRLRNALTLNLSGPASAGAGTIQPLHLSVVNSGSGHNFPTGFPEGRNAWVAIRAFDVDTGAELELYDAVWNRTSLGVGYLTSQDTVDPNFPECHWSLPAGSPDPYAWQFKAVASLGDGCPTLDLPYATALNMVVNADGMPIDTSGKIIDRNHPQGLPQYSDLDGDGDLYDDAFLIDTRLRPLPHPGATVQLDRYAVIIPPGTVGPVAVTAAVYYQSFEAMVAKKVLGNLADTDLDFKLEPCVLKGACDGRVATVEPAVVEGAPPVPMEVTNWVINIAGHADTRPPAAATYPPANATDVYADAVIKVSFSEPVNGIDSTTFTLVDESGLTVPARVDQIGDYTWGLFPNRVFLKQGATYTARLAAPVCDFNANCTASDIVWHFTITTTPGGGTGDTRIPSGGNGMSKRNSEAALRPLVTPAQYTKTEFLDVRSKAMGNPPL